MREEEYRQAIRDLIKKEKERRQKDEDRKKYPLFHWRETCKPLPKPLPEEDWYPDEYFIWENGEIRRIAI